MNEISRDELIDILKIAFQKVTRKKSLRKLYGHPLQNWANVEQAWRTINPLIGVWPMVLYANGTKYDNIDPIDNLLSLPYQQTLTG